MRKWIALVLMLSLVLSLSAASMSASASYRFTVVFQSPALPADAGTVVTDLGGMVVSEVPELGVMTVTGPAQLMDRLNNHPAILAASPAIEFQLPADEFTPMAVEQGQPDTAGADFYNLYQWDIKQVTNHGGAWALSSGSHNTVVGIIDTGISTQHPDLRANLLGGENFANDGPDGTIDPLDIEDRQGHGSHVAGAIAGNGRILGVAPDIGIRAYRILRADGYTTLDTILKGVAAAVRDDVDVISMSLGAYVPIGQATWTDPETGETYRLDPGGLADFLAFRRAVQYAVNHGVVVVAAAGNDTIDVGNPIVVGNFRNDMLEPYGYHFTTARLIPGTLSGVVTVSATGPDNQIASYSNFGQAAIDLSAPGGGFARYGKADDWITDLCWSSYKDGTYAWGFGTSVSTPKVAAVAALIIDQAKANGETLTPAQVVARLQQTATDLGKPGYDPYFGHGLVNAYSALGGR